MRPFPENTQEEFLARLLHDLRQPLGNIGLSTFYLNLLLGQSGEKVQGQIQIIEQQVDRASGILAEAAAELVRLRPQTPAVENLELTKAATSAVT
jgi:signal transduction histidine kinase